MTTRTYANTVWDVISPSHYQLTGHPEVEAIFDGRHWFIKQLEHFPHASMKEISEWVLDTFESYPDITQGEIL